MLYVCAAHIQLLSIFNHFECIVRIIVIPMKPMTRCSFYISIGNTEFLSEMLNFYRILTSGSIQSIFSIVSSVRHSADYCDTNEADDKMKLLYFYREP